MGRWNAYVDEGMVAACKRVDRLKQIQADDHSFLLVRRILPPEWQVSYPVLCIASRRPLDEGAAVMLAQILGKHGLAAWVQPFADVSSVKNFKIDALDARLVCVSYFGHKPLPPI